MDNKFYISSFDECGPGASSSKKLGYGVEGLGAKGVEIFFAPLLPDWFWDPLSLL